MATEDRKERVGFAVRLNGEQRTELTEFAMYFAAVDIDQSGLSEQADAFDVEPAALSTLYESLGPYVRLVRELHAGVDITEVDTLRDLAERVKQYALRVAMDDCDMLAAAGDPRPEVDGVVLEDVRSTLARADLASDVLESVG